MKKKKKMYLPLKRPKNLLCVLCATVKFVIRTIKKHHSSNEIYLIWLIRPYKISMFTMFQFSRKKRKKNNPVAQLQYMFFPCVRGMLNLLRGYWDTGRTSSWILQIYIRNFTFFQRFLIFKFKKKSKLSPVAQFQ